MALDSIISEDVALPEAAPSGDVIVVEDLWRTYDMGSEQQVHALRGVSLRIRHNEYVAIMGPSGSGKSTLMNLIGCLDTPSKGKYWLNGQLVSELDDDQLARIRNKEIGFVFQTFNLLARATSLHNVELPLIYNGTPAAARIERAKESLTNVGLGDRMNHKPNELSGGQRQRVAIAAAMVLKPKLLLADEPVSMLDVSVRAGILRLLDDLRRDGLAIVMITHDLSTAAHFADRIAVMYLGRIVEEGPARDVVRNPLHPYTKALISVVPKRDPRDATEPQILTGETPNPIFVPSGCRFHPRCPIAQESCKSTDPELRRPAGATAPDHRVACILA
jgi:putative ABC transport system ATP-binding protein